VHHPSAGLKRLPGMLLLQCCLLDSVADLMAAKAPLASHWLAGLTESGTLS